MPKAPALADTPIFLAVDDEFKALGISILQLMNSKRWSPEPVNTLFYSTIKRVPMTTEDGRTLAPIIVDAEVQARGVLRGRQSGPGISRR